MLHSSEIKIGTMFNVKESKKGICQYTVIDILKTYNHNNELVKTSYKAEKDFLSQKISNEFCAVTIQRGYISYTIK